MNENLFHTQSVANAANSSSIPQSIFDKLKELSDKMREYPNVLVMTKATLCKLQKQTDPIAPEVCTSSSAGSPMPFAGIPLEYFDTVKECLDRMMNPQAGERLQLVLSEEIPFDCASHPWSMRQAAILAERYAVDYRMAMPRQIDW